MHAASNNNKICLSVKQNFLNHKLLTGSCKLVSFSGKLTSKSKKLSGVSICQREKPKGSDSPPALRRDELVVAAAGTALLAATAITQYREVLADALFGDGISTGVSAWGLGDATGAVLWALSLYYISPIQLLLIFLGRVDADRPSDWLQNTLAEALGNDVSRAEYSHSLAIQAFSILLLITAGSIISWSFSAALGDATWCVSTGLGSCLAAGIYEVSRPDRLSPLERKQLEEQYNDFASFADQRLQPRGSCHETEIFTAFRQSFARYRSKEVLDEKTLRQFIRSWAKQYVFPAAERTSTGYFKSISLRERIDPFTAAKTESMRFSQKD